ncbi:hypothetical protein [Mesoflavibacter sp. CH_XMU1404-2]|uniref:hypothetical protein n=1 Tax=Mesoflavibacter sp. CH_XMU1404-2 TaxID=3107766 RepID=UPI00300B1FB0
MKRPRIKRPRVKSKKNKKSSFRTKRSLIKEQNKIKKKIKKLKSVIQKEQKNTISLETKKKRIQEIEKSFKKNGIINQLKYNNEYNDLKNNNKKNTTSSKKHKSELSKLESDLLIINKDIEQLQKEIIKNSETKIVLTKQANKKRAQEIKKEIAKEKTKANPILEKFKENKPSIRHSFDVDWDNVFFKDRKITIRHNNQWYDKYISESKKFLNEIKHYYKFHNVPKLKVLIEKERVIIQNEEVLFYHIDFLNITASNFGYLQLPKLNIDKWKKYNKQYYKSNLTFLLHTHTLKKLCEYSVPKLPIIPVGEAVISSNGSSTIHNSFLFPLKSKTGYLLIWESIEEGKASYVFSINSYSNKSIQNIFNYIAGETQNKRSSLLSSQDLQNKLNMKERILHTDLNSWEMEIRQLVKK